jgi:hypothetical protein
MTEIRFDGKRMKGGRETNFNNYFSFTPHYYIQIDLTFHLKDCEKKRYESYVYRCIISLIDVYISPFFPLLRRSKAIKIVVVYISQKKDELKKKNYDVVNALV